MTSADSNTLDDDRIGRLLFKLALPSFLGMFVIALYNIVDTIFVGRYVGPLGIAGLSIVFPLQMLWLGIGQLVGIGGASVISRMIGGGRIDRAERTLGNGLSLVLGLSAVTVAAGLADVDFWLRLMGASETVLPYARDYMIIVIFGMFFQTMALAGNGLIRAEGNARVPMLAMFIGGGANIGLDALFIIPLDMGIRGAALATVVAQAASLAFILGYYLSGRSFLRLRAAHLRIELSILKAIAAIGIASFSRTLATSLSIVLMNKALVVHGGDLAVSAFGIVNRIIFFAIMPSITIAQGLQPVLGYNTGARRYGRALRSIKLAVAGATGICLLLFALVELLPQPIIGVFTEDRELIALATRAARLVFAGLALVGFIMVGSLTFQAIGLAGRSFLTAIARPVLFLIPALLVLPHYLGLDGIWLVFPVSDLLTFLLTLALLLPQLRRFKRKAA